MSRRSLPFLLPLLLLAAPLPANAARFTDGPCGPPVATGLDGFIETTGPGAYAPEHAGDFKPPGPDACPPIAAAAPPAQPRAAPPPPR